MKMYLRIIYKEGLCLYGKYIVSLKGLHLELHIVKYILYKLTSS